MLLDTDILFLNKHGQKQHSLRRLIKNSSQLHGSIVHFDLDWSHLQLGPLVSTSHTSQQNFSFTGPMDLPYSLHLH